VARVTAKDILLAVIIPLALAELGPWCGWLAAKVLPLAAKLRYGETERAAVRLEEWSDDLDDIPGQLTKLAYAFGQLAAGSAVSARRKATRATAYPSQGALFEAYEMPGKAAGAVRPGAVDAETALRAARRIGDYLTAHPRADPIRIQSELADGDAFVVPRKDAVMLAQILGSLGSSARLTP